MPNHLHRRLLAAHVDVASCAVSAVQSKASQHQQESQRQEPEIPRQRTAEIVAHMMDTEDLVVNGPLDDVEQPPAETQQTSVRAPARWSLAALPCAHEQSGSHQHEHPRRQMEEPVRDGVALQAPHGVDRAAFCGTHKVVPLKQLVQNDPVNEPAEAKAKQDSRNPLTSGLAYLLTEEPLPEEPLPEVCDAKSSPPTMPPVPIPTCWSCPSKEPTPLELCPA